MWAAFSPEGGRLVTAGRDGTARLWDALSGKPLTALLRHEQAVLFAAFSPDGHRVLTVSKGNQSRVWDADTGEPLTPPIPHASAAGPSAFSASGRYLLTLHPSYVACVWDLHRETSPPALLKPRDGLNKTESRVGAYLAQVSMKAVPAQAWSDESRRFLLMENRHAKVQVWDTASRAPITPQVQSRYSLESLAATKVNLPTVSAPTEDLTRLAELLAGNRLDETGGWESLVLPRIVSLWGTPQRRSASESWPAYLGPSSVSLNGWHRQEAAAAEAASDWGAAMFHWHRLAALQPDTPEIRQRLAYTSECAARAASHSYADGRRLATLRQEQAKSAERDRALSAHDPGAIKQWLVLAPISIAEGQGVAALDQEQIAKEAMLRPRAGDRVKVGGRELVWGAQRLGDSLVDFTQFVGEGTDWSVAYAVSYVESAAAQTGLLLKVGSDDEAKIYLNGEEIYRFASGRTWVPDQDAVAGIRLNAGLNVVVFKVINEVANWQGSVHFADVAGQPVKGISVILDPGTPAPP